MNPNFKKKKPLPYKNLGELYTETAYQEPSISRLVSVLLENGTVEVISHDASDSRNLTQDYKVDKDYFNNAIIPRLVLGHPDSVKIREEISARLTKLNALNLAETTDMYQGFINDLNIVLNDSKASEFGDTLTNNFYRGTFSKLLADTYKLSASPAMHQNWRGVFEAIPDTLKLARPGDGELFISFFSNTSRPNKGDVEINGAKIEVKGNEGRLYKGGVRRIKLPSEAEFNGSKDADGTIIPGYEDIKKISFITDFIINLAGGGEKSVIEDLVKNNLNLLSVQLYNPIQHNRAPLLTRIIGAQHLLLYKESQGFDTFLIFIFAGPIPFISFKMPLSLSEMIEVFTKNDVSVKIHAPKTGEINTLGHQIVWPASKNA